MCGFGECRNLMERDELLLHLDTINENVREIAQNVHRDIIRNERLLLLETFDFTLDESSLLGRGTFSEVKIGRYGNHSVAIKVITSREDTMNESQRNSLENEVLLLSDCRHPCVLQLHGYCKVNHQTWNLILELCPLGSLWSYLTDNADNPPIPLNLSLAWISDINSALCYLHRQGIIHRDLRAENVLLTEGRNCKLTGFGLSTRLESSFGTSHTRSASSAFTAPELNNGRPSNRSDVYAFGVTCYQILFRTPPPVPDTARTICEFTSTLNLPLLNELMNLCLSDLPERRITAGDSFALVTRLQHQSLEDPRIDSQVFFPLLFLFNVMLGT
jgi:serine/threonine protein kinase